MNAITYSRFRIVLCVIALFLIWQALKFIPWFQHLQKSDDDPSSSTAVTPVLVTVFYEALCPDSKNFIVRQLLPTITQASRLINVSLVPYGKAKTEVSPKGSFSFSCQHGPVECIANKIHACAISNIKNSILQVKYLSCMIYDNMIPDWIGEKCAKELSIDWKSILECSNSEKGNILLSDFGKMTDSLNPKMTFVPTVLLNNKRRNQAAVLKDFFKEVCSVLNNLPEECQPRY